MSVLRTALLQSSGRPGDPAAQLAAIGDAARRAADAGAGLLVCPELFLTGYALDEGLHRLAEPADGPSAQAVARTARETGVAIVYGYPERDGEQVHNAVQFVPADCAPATTYRKAHLYGAYERRWFTPGADTVVQARVDGLTVGLMVCYDVEFPEFVRAHALAGTDLLLVPTAQLHPYEFVAESLVPVRAFENQMYVAYVNRTGPEGEWDFVGLSCLAGPDGTALARAGRAEELLFADVDTDLLAAGRDRNPYLADRRPELYGALTGRA